MVHIMGNTLESRNLTMLVDFYELSMANGYFTNGLKDKIAYFDIKIFAPSEIPIKRLMVKFVSEPVEPTAPILSP